MFSRTAPLPFHSSRLGRSYFFFPLLYPAPGLLKILKYSPFFQPSFPSILLFLSLFLSVPPEGVRRFLLRPSRGESSREFGGTATRLRLICKRIFALINGFKKNKLKKEGGEGREGEQKKKENACETKDGGHKRVI